MGKEEIFSKLNIKDYNNELEKIIEKKAFSEDTKNLLLSMFYKVENAYDDYKKIKVIEKTKKEELEEILNVIEKGCKNIAIIKPKINEETALGEKRSTSIRKEKKIISYPNEKSLYYALCKLQEERYIADTKLYILDKALELMMNSGLYINNAEIIRDFDGWSWNTEKEEIENFIYNLIYQNILIVVNEEDLKKWLYNKQHLKNIIEILGEKMYKLICKIALIEYIKDDKDKEEAIINIKDELIKKILEMSDKKKYLKEIAENKKSIEKEIKKIDSLVSNMKELKEEFLKENNKLEENQKVFSLSDFVEIKQRERFKYINELKEYSQAMNPTFFVNTKEQIEKQIDIISNIQKEKEFKLIIDLQKEVIKNFTKKIDKIETKKEIYDMIYKLRYYKEIFMDKNNQIKDIKGLKKNIEDIEKRLLTIACNFKVLNILSNNIEENYKMISNILNTRIIDLEDIIVEIKKKENKVILNIYEDAVLEKVVEYKEIMDLNIKYNKKIKLFI